jgi:hypothetical protein
MPSIIYDFDALREAANLLEGADLPMNIVQPMAVDAEPAQLVENHVAWTMNYYEPEPVIPADYDYGC